MPRSLLENCCVRITVNKSDGTKKLGSGVIISKENSYYVLTAAHCLCKEEMDWNSISPEMINVEFQKDYTSEHFNISAKGIKGFSLELDWCIIEIEKPAIECDFSKVHLGFDFLPGEKVIFSGYQAINSVSKRCWDANIIQIAERNFRIKITDQTFDQGGNLGHDIASGLSGSGVYIIKDNALYLIGHLLEVTGKIALNNDVNCCMISNLKPDFESLNWINLSDISGLQAWEDSLDQEIDEESISEWIKVNDKYFNNLLRKSKILYKDEKAISVAKERLIEFLVQEYKNSKIRGNGNFIEKFEAASNKFEKTVKRDYTRDVESSSEAKDLLLMLQKDFAQHLSPLINDKTSFLNNDLSQYKVTWWLLNCSFDFTEE